MITYASYKDYGFFVTTNNENIIAKLLDKVVEKYGVLNPKTSGILYNCIDAIAEDVDHNHFIYIEPKSIGYVPNYEDQFKYLVSFFYDPRNKAVLNAMKNFVSEDPDKHIALDKERALECVKRLIDATAFENTPGLILYDYYSVFDRNENSVLKSAEDDFRSICEEAIADHPAKGHFYGC